MNLRDFLEQRERELDEEIQKVRVQMAALEISLVPLEGELADVRRARNTAASGTGFVRTGIGSPFGLGGNLVGAMGIGAGLIPFGGIVGARHDATDTAASIHLPEPSRLAVILASSPYAALTMKQLIVKALTEHFPYGATTRELLNFFRDAWGRNIERTNLSPQISRLYKDGVIGRRGATWVLVDATLEETHHADADSDDR